MSCSREGVGVWTDGLLTLIVGLFIEDSQLKNSRLTQRKDRRPTVAVVSYHSE